MTKKVCEICADTVVAPVIATKCGHRVYLCETCKVECKSALRVCVKCEDKGM